MRYDGIGCSGCGLYIDIMAFIEDQEVIKNILKHLDLWNVKAQPPPKADPPPHNIEPHSDYSESQLPPSSDALYGDESR